MIVIQVDIFWSYALGAMFAAAACRQLKQETNKWANKYFIGTVLYLALFFAPSGLYLVWTFTAWESMQVFAYPQMIPAWLVIIFGITNVTNGILGYLVVWALTKKNRYYEAWLQTVIGYFLMFFVLVHGWDGTGYQRFLYDASAPWNGGIWSAGMLIKTGTLWTHGMLDTLWVLSPVALTLVGMGILILPPLFIYCSKWMVQGIETDPSIKEKAPSKSRVIIFALISVFGLTFGLVLLSSMACWFFTFILNVFNPAFSSYLAPLVAYPNWTISINSIIGMCIGLPIVLIPAYLFVLRRGAVFFKVYEKFIVPDPPLNT